MGVDALDGKQVRSGARYLLVGGAGFIGSHFVDRLLSLTAVEAVTVYDNFTVGRESHYAHHRGDARLTVVRGDVTDDGRLRAAMAGHDTVVHLASNADIARAAREPAIDFEQGTVLTHHIVEAMRVTGATTILYASGSGVYGDAGERELHEDDGPLLPISTYGASKLAGEGLISAYAHMFDISGRIFRFGNVVGRRQTHGVGFDFVRSLLRDPTTLRVLGDGSQSKSYIHVDDVIDAVLLATEKTLKPVETYNVATGDYVTVREIAVLATECVGLTPGGTRFEFSREPRGWKGDVPVVRLRTDRIRSLGWSNRMSSREALRESMLAIAGDTRAGRY